MSEKEALEGAAPAAPSDDVWQGEAGSVYREFSTKSWTKEEARSKALEPAEFDKLVVASPFAKQVSLPDFQRFDQPGLDGKRDGVVHMDELEDAKRSGKFDAKTNKAIEGLQRIILDHPGKVGLSFGDQFHPMFPGIRSESIAQAHKSQGAAAKEQSWSIRRLFGK